jgi:hypothetical protein
MDLMVLCFWLCEKLLFPQPCLSIRHTHIMWEHSKAIALWAWEPTSGIFAVKHKMRAEIYYNIRLPALCLNIIYWMGVRISSSVMCLIFCAIWLSVCLQNNGFKSVTMDFSGSWKSSHTFCFSWLYADGCGLMFQDMGNYWCVGAARSYKLCIMNL